MGKHRPEEKDARRTADVARQPKSALRRWGVMVLFTALASVLIAAYVQKKHGARAETLLAKRGDFVRRRWDVPCAEKPDAGSVCAPKVCGRAVVDDFVTEEEARMLRQLAQDGMAYGTPGGGPAILDLVSGAVTDGDKFVNVFERMKQMNRSFNATLLKTFTSIKKRIRKEVMQQFGTKKLHLTKPTFFARITGGVAAKTLNDEYWHVHVDKYQYGSFVFTGLLYLSDYGIEFDGGVFAFVEGSGQRNFTVEPASRRLLLFTSGEENPHQVRLVTRGDRLVLTIAFTCDPSAAVPIEEEDK